MAQWIVDTNILMGIENFEKLLQEYIADDFIVPYEVLQELDNNKWKDGDKGYKARRAIQHIERNKQLLAFEPTNSAANSVDDCLIEFALTTDCGILSNDISMSLKAEALGITVRHYKEHLPINAGWVKVAADTATDVDTGQYVLQQDEWNTRTEKVFRVMENGAWKPIFDARFKSNYFPIVKPLDEFQTCAMDSLKNDDFTIITGHAGTGKTLLSLSYALAEVASGHKRKLNIFVNPTKARGAEELGFYSGDRTEKLLQNSIGAILSTKLGDSLMVDLLLQQNKLEIFPISDIRGAEIHPDDILYITEAQNLSTDLAKLCIQRAAEGAKIILEGDPETQLDNWAFEGKNNGLKRAIEVFTGMKGFGHVNLPIIRRSKMAAKAEEM
jgi:predicted ribonuclease YlaK